MIRYLFLPAIFLFAFILESVFLAFVPSYGQADDYVLVPYFLFITLVFGAVYYHRNTTLIYALIFGAIFDIFYTGLMGVYAYLFPLITYLVCKLMFSLHRKLLIVSVFSLVGISFIEFIVLGIQTAIGQNILSMEDFMYNRLWATLVTNIIFLLLFGYFLQKIFTRFLKLEEK